ncbi:MAG: isoaspartyl peptidase/L-asparaginase, partial [Candidatus Aenigmarchaeota archaeon]|nr:isoaspartyl peptidase/L-asparaginase [Candidatus Aenigmarchaeota archaeon]
MASIILHGGAGSGGYGKKGEKALEKALAVGKKCLAKNSVDAVTKAISSMEDSGIFDAGKGSYYQLDGKIRMDASIMTSGMKCGAVAGIEEVRNPIMAARKVMELTDHVMLSGTHATKFALKSGLSVGKLGTMENYAYWTKLKHSLKGKDFMQTLAKLHELRKERYFSTVGCVALDDSGVLCAGTSTGGIGIMLPGRVGDTQLIG